MPKEWTRQSRNNRTCAIKLDNVLFDAEGGHCSWGQARRMKEFCDGVTDPKLRRHVEKSLMRIRQLCPTLREHLGRRKRHRKTKRSR